MFNWLRKKRKEPIEAKLPLQSEVKAGRLPKWSKLSRQMKERRAYAWQQLQPYQPPKGVINPELNAKIAEREGVTMSDSAADPLGRSDMVSMLGNFYSGGMPDDAIYRGMTFRGYPWLAWMAQDASYRKPCDVIAAECVREWIEITATGETDEKAQQRIEQVEKAFRDFKVRELCHKVMWQALIFGVAHVYIADSAVDEEDAEGANKPLRLTPDGFSKGQLKGSRVVEPTWVTPTLYQATNPLKRDWYKPETWWCLSYEVHKSRLKQIIPYPVSELLLPSYNWGGQSLLQQTSPFVENYNKIRDAIPQIVVNSSLLCLATNMSTNADGDNFQSIEGRAELAKDVSSGQGTVIYDSNEEDAKFISASLAGYAEIYSKYQEAQAAIPGIPLVKLFGETPSGLNATSEGEIRVWFDHIASIQEAHLRPLLRDVLKAVMLHLWGEIDPTISFNFMPLWQMDEEKQANIARTNAATDAENIQSGKITSQEAREAEETDENSRYNQVDLASEDAPGPPGQMDLTGGDEPKFPDDEHQEAADKSDT